MEKNLRKSLHFVEQGFDNLKAAFLHRRGYIKDVRLISYYGYGNDNLISFEGRVLKDREIAATRSNDTIFENIERMYKHFGSIELPGVSVTATYGLESRSTLTDDEGYYKFEFPFQSNLDKSQLWHQIGVKLSQGQDFEASQTAWVQVPLPNTAFGVISDIDDTILQTGSSNRLKSITTTFTKNADTRLSFPGVHKLYSGLQNGNTPFPVNPIFYLSNSPWNLYDFLVEFMELKNIPKGSLLLRDWGLDDEKIIVDDNHKLNSIDKLLNTYPELPFILIGDSGEKDPEYYHKIVQQFPKRILAIYIRDVSDEPRDSGVRNIVKEVEALGVPMFLMEDSYTAAEHAEAMGWINKETIELVREAVWH